MKASARWYFDVISPFAYLQWQRMADLHSVFALQPVPILLGAVLSHHGQLGPAEIPSKRRFAYRFIRWHAAQHGVALTFPEAHPFNPLPALRSIVALDCDATAIDIILRHIWHFGRPADSVQALVAGELGAWLQAQGIDDFAARVETPEVKAALKRNTELAIAEHVFGVPTIAVAEELFWGFDATDYAIAFAHDPTLCRDAEAQRLLALPVAAERKRS